LIKALKKFYLLACKARQVIINLKKSSNPMGQGRTNEMLLILKHLPSISY